MPQKHIIIVGITFSMIVHTDAAYYYMSEKMLIMLGLRLEHATVVHLPHKKKKERNRHG